MGVFKTMWNRSHAEKLPLMEEIEQFGADGEEGIYRALCESFDCVIRNVVVPHKKLYLEKDFMVIHKGIAFVLEVKNWKGEIGCDGTDFYQNKDNGVKKTLKSPVGTTRQFVERMRDFYGIATPICGMVVFCDTGCTINLPEEMDGIALLSEKKMVSYIKAKAKSLGKPAGELDPSRILRCTRFYSRDSEFCKGILADSFFECKTRDGDTVLIDTLSLRYLSVESQALRLRDKLLVTYVNGACDVFYSADTVFTVACLDGTYRKISLNRIRHIVF
ncbi:MAG: NERD domain-containing protein [Clostridia bacterium]|nr:NERD domain-containing protein [Clostridia bacterium]MBQ9785788.1 NERD domain-containing protein [Clostridia bacterium]